MWKIIDKIWLFLENVFNALKFASFDYDARLRLKKTPRERVIIWVTIVMVTFAFGVLLFLLIGSFLRSLINH